MHSSWFCMHTFLCCIFIADKTHFSKASHTVSIKLHKDRKYFSSYLIKCSLNGQFEFHVKYGLWALLDWQESKPNIIEICQLFYFMHFVQWMLLNFFIREIYYEIWISCFYVQVIGSGLLRRIPELDWATGAAPGFNAVGTEDSSRGVSPFRTLPGVLLLTCHASGIRCFLDEAFNAVHCVCSYRTKK